MLGTVYTNFNDKNFSKLKKSNFRCLKNNL